MTQRSMSASMLTEIAKTKNEPFHLFEFEWDSATVRFTDAGMDLTWSANTYTNAANVLGFSNIDENLSMDVSEISLVLTGISSTVIAYFLTENFIDRPCRIYKGFLDTSGVIVSDPVLIFSGRLDSPSMEEDPASGTATITCSAADHFIDFDTTNGRKTNPTEQKAYFPGDKGFDFVHTLQDKVIQWGKPT
jgi:hypothetical protein